MSVAVELSDLARHLKDFGTVAYLTTVDEDGRPHVVSVRPRLEGARLHVGAGRRTSANVTRQARVSLLWPAAPGGAYSLIVDGHAALAGEGGEATLAVAPEAAVLHRTPDGDPSAPSCVTVLARP